jgi:hypothetical protein
MNDTRDAKKFLLKKVCEVYGGSRGYRTTASGRKVAYDEPTGDKELELADKIRQNLQKQRAQASAARLKAKGNVPTRKDGRKLFEDFMREATKASGSTKPTAVDAELLNIYNAAAWLDYDKWLIFLVDTAKGWK